MIFYAKLSSEKYNSITINNKGATMKKKKIIVSSAVLAAAATGGTYAILNQPVSATEDTTAATENTESTTKSRQRKELSEEKKAEIKAKLETMTEEEKQAWLESHKKTGQRDTSRREKPANMTDEEWEAKKAERKAKMKEKLESMTEEEKQAWLEAHPRKSNVL